MAFIMTLWIGNGAVLKSSSRWQLKEFRILFSKFFLLPEINDSIDQDQAAYPVQSDLDLITCDPCQLYPLSTIDIFKFSQLRNSILSFNPFPNKPWFLRVCSTSLLKTLWEKEELLVTSNSSFSHSVFYPFGELSAIFIKARIVVCKLFQFGGV